MQTLSQQALQHQMGQDSSYMIQALIHNSDPFPKWARGLEDWRAGQSGEGKSKKVPGTRKVRAADCLHTSHPASPGVVISHKTSLRPSRSGERQVFRSGLQSRWLRAQVYSKSQLRSAQPVSQQGASGICMFQVPQEILRNRPPGKEQG